MITVATKRDRRMDTGLLILRTVVGVVFMAHGWQKLFLNGVGATTAGFAQMGIPLPEIAAPLVSGLEFIGGIALILGLLTRVFGALLAIDMLVAMLLVHLPNGFFLPAGIEFTLTLMAASVTLMLAGAGSMSVDDALKRRRVMEIAPVEDVVVRDRRKIHVKV